MAFSAKSGLVCKIDVVLCELDWQLYVWVIVIDFNSFLYIKQVGTSLIVCEIVLN